MVPAYSATKNTMSDLIREVAVTSVTEEAECEVLESQARAAMTTGAAISVSMGKVCQDEYQDRCWIWYLKRVRTNSRSTYLSNSRQGHDPGIAFGLQNHNTESLLRLLAKEA